MSSNARITDSTDFLPRDDLSWFPRTQKLMEAWFVLSNEDISVVVDSVKPRILQVFAHGRFGRLQQIIYGTNGHERYAGLWGIVAAYYPEGKRFLPFIHQPQNYFFATHPGEAHYSNQPDGLLCKGGMHDLTLGEAGLFLKKYFGFEFGEGVASCGFGNRLAESVLHNGAMYGVIIDVPNYHHRRENGAETLNYGAMGGYGYHYVAQAR